MPSDVKLLSMLPLPTPPAAEDPVPEPVTVVASRTVRPGREHDFEQWAEAVLEVASEFPGYLGSSLLRPGQGGHEHHVVYRFEDTDALETWERSEERRRWLERADDLVEDVRVHKTSGLETWFSLPERPAPAPPKWKMALVVLVAIFPISLTFQLLVGVHLVGLPLPLRVLATSLVLVPTMTWIVMPRLTRVLRSWLYPEPGAGAAVPATTRWRERLGPRRSGAPLLGRLPGQLIRS